MSIFIGLVLIFLWSNIVALSLTGTKYKFVGEWIAYLMAGIGFAESVVLPIMNLYK